MKEVTRTQYISSVIDYEQLYLIEAISGKVFLCSDIEYGGDLQIPRIEMMYFEMDISLSFHNACSECRARYTGGINFAEYQDELSAEKTWVLCTRRRILCAIHAISAFLKTARECT